MSWNATRTLIAAASAGLAAGTATADAVPPARDVADLGPCPTLERVEGQPDLLTAILSAR